MVRPGFNQGSPQAWACVPSIVTPRLALARARGASAQS